MTENVVDNALRLLRESSKSAYAIALGTGISKPTIGKYMKGETKPSAIFAEKLVNYFTCDHNGGPMLNTTPILTTEETDPRSINPKKSPDMDISIALDFIGHLKEEVASLKEQLAAKDAQIEQLIDKLPGGGV